MPVVDRREIARPGAAVVALPEVIVDAGPAAVERFLEFFAAAIANDRTRSAYGQAAGQFLGWCGARGLGLRAIAPLHVAAYIRTHPGSVPTVKQHLAAIRALLDWLVVHQVLPVNPAASVRGPKYGIVSWRTWDPRGRSRGPSDSFYFSEHDCDGRPTTFDALRARDPVEFVEAEPQPAKGPRAFAVRLARGSGRSTRRSTRC